MRPSWRCRVKIGMCAAMMISIEKTSAAPLPMRLKEWSRTVSSGRPQGQLRQSRDDVLGHDHRAIDDDAEVHRTQRQQVGRYAPQMQAEEGRQQRKRHHRRHDQCGAGVVQEQPQHQEHQHRAFKQVAEDGFQRGRDQPRAVVERLDADPVRQLVGLDLGDARMQGVEHVGRILALAHQHHAEHRIVIAVLADQALPGQAGVGDAGQVTHQDWRAPRCATTTLPMSAGERIRPTPRIRNCCCPRST